MMRTSLTWSNESALDPSRHLHVPSSEGTYKFASIRLDRLHMRNQLDLATPRGRGEGLDVDITERRRKMKEVARTDFGGMSSNRQGRVLARQSLDPIFKRGKNQSGSRFPRDRRSRFDPKIAFPEHDIRLASPPDFNKELGKSSEYPVYLNYLSLVVANDYASYSNSESCD